MAKNLNEVEVGQEASPLLIELLSRERVREYWPQLETELRRMPELWENYWTLDWIRRQMLDGSYQVWLFGDEREIEFAMVTQILEYPASRVLQLLHAWGRLEDPERILDAAEPMMESFAIQNGCQILEAVVRPGWERLLAKRGAKRRRLVMSRAVVQTEMQ